MLIHRQAVFDWIQMDLYNKVTFNQHQIQSNTFFILETLDIHKRKFLFFKLYIISAISGLVRWILLKIKEGAIWKDVALWIL